MLCIQENIIQPQTDVTSKAYHTNIKKGTENVRHKNMSGIVYYIHMYIWISFQWVPSLNLDIVSMGDKTLVM